MATKKQIEKIEAAALEALGKGQPVIMYQLTAANTIAQTTAYPGMETGLQEDGWTFAEPDIPEVEPQDAPAANVDETSIDG